MTQEIKIGIKADPTGAEQAMKGLEKTVNDVATSFQSAGKWAGELNKLMHDMEEEHHRIGQAQEVLRREFSKPITYADAKIANSNFERIRAGRGIGARRLRGFDNFEEWYLGHTASFSKASDAERHRRFVLSSAMQGTDYSRQNGAPPTRPPGGGDGGDGNGDGGGDPFRRGVGRAQSIAMGFVKGGLAMAGINSLGAMAGQAVTDATDELLGTDLLKRRLGDLGVDFDTLRNQVRNAADGFGVTYVESMKYAQAFAKEAGNLNDPGKLGGELHNAYGFSQAFGIDKNQGVQFFATMARLGVMGGKDDPEGRKLAGNIADAIERSGYTGKADEVLSAVANFSDTFARNSLARPNAAAYAGMMAGLTSTGLPGLDPNNAASMLSTADQMIRKGGGMGEAGQNFNYMALMRKGHGMDPVAAKALMQGGLFATTRSIFGKGSALEGMYGGKLDDVTNLQKIRDQTKAFYGGGSWGVEAFANNTGLTLAQAKELFDASPLKLAQAKDLDPRMAEKDEGTKTRDSIADLKNELTRVGGVLLDPLNGIRTSAVALADRFAPKSNMVADSAFASNAAAQNPAIAAYLKDNPAQNPRLGKLLRNDAAAQARYAMGGMSWLYGKPSDQVQPAEMYGSLAERKLLAGARDAQFDQVNHWISMMSDTDKLLGLNKGSTLRQVYKESHMDRAAVSRAGAKGLAQFMPSTWAMYAPRFKKIYGHDPVITDGDDSIEMERLYMADLLKARHGNYAEALSMYNSGRPTPNNPETRDYVASLAGHPLPAGPQPSTAPGGPTNVAVAVHVTSDPVHLVDPSGQHRGLVTLKPTAQPVPAGM